MSRVYSLCQRKKHSTIICVLLQEPRPQFLLSWCSNLLQRDKKISQSCLTPLMKTIVFANVQQVQTVLREKSSKSKAPSPHSKVPSIDTWTGIIKASEPPSKFPSRNDACLCLCESHRWQLAKEEDLYIASHDPTINCRRWLNANWVWKVLTQ